MRISKRVNEQKDKRTGRNQVFDRQPLPDVNIPNYTLREVIDFVMKINRANNLKERTLHGCIAIIDYFIEWICAKYGEVSIQEVTASIMRDCDYVLCYANEKGYYEGHPIKLEFSKDRIGFAPFVNVRIRVLRTFFNILHQRKVRP
ncbi:hypothetical protein [Paenibacillus sp. N3.4]|uniref:hypothetical protein n=1 Tax=Paenibacillus sp. N3.4 TaxID=2603222 RepID=UPI0021C4BB99|nr:hypothetical protein [Paenibacillus sp. N3.4]